MLSSSKTDSASSTTSPPEQQFVVVDVSASDSSLATSNGGVSEDLVNSVDQFLREALQNPRERLSGTFYVIFKLCWCCCKLTILLGLILT